ncbi:hypothetical protein BAMA111019_22380 [Bacillus manliponensis]
MEKKEQLHKIREALLILKEEEKKMHLLDILLNRSKERAI